MAILPASWLRGILHQAAGRRTRALRGGGTASLDRGTARATGDAAGVVIEKHSAGGQPKPEAIA
jgi:hypothetical protein